MKGFRRPRAAGSTTGLRCKSGIGFVYGASLVLSFTMSGCGNESGTKDDDFHYACLESVADGGYGLSCAAAPMPYPGPDRPAIPDVCEKGGAPSQRPCLPSIPGRGPSLVTGLVFEHGGDVEAPLIPGCESCMSSGRIVTIAPNKLDWQRPFNDQIFRLSYRATAEGLELEGGQSLAFENDGETLVHQGIKYKLFPAAQNGDEESRHDDVDTASSDTRSLVGIGLAFSCVISEEAPPWTNHRGSAMGSEKSAFREPSGHFKLQLLDASGYQLLEPPAPQRDLNTEEEGAQVAWGSVNHWAVDPVTGFYFKCRVNLEARTSYGFEESHRRDVKKAKKSERSQGRPEREKGLWRPVEFRPGPSSFVGFDELGAIRACERARPDVVCTMEWRINDLLPEACRAAGFEVFDCGCHSLCSGRVELDLTPYQGIDRVHDCPEPRAASALFGG